jgi:hypothetical protein
LLVLREEVTHAITLCSKVLLRFWVYRHVNWLASFNRESKTIKSAKFGRIVSKKSKSLNAKIHEYLCADAVFTAVDREAKFEIRVDRIEAGILKLIGPKLVTDADASALVSSQVDDYTSTIFCNSPHRFIELRSTVTFDARKDVTCETFAVHAHKNRLVTRLAGDVASHEG